MFLTMNIETLANQKFSTEINITKQDFPEKYKNSHILMAWPPDISTSRHIYEINLLEFMTHTYKIIF